MVIALAALAAGAYISTSAAVVAVLGTYGAMIAGGLVSMAISAVFAKSPDQPQGMTQDLRDNLVTVRQPISNWQYIYGRTRVSGVITYAEATTAAGLNNVLLHLIITFAGHVSEEISDIYFDDEIVPLGVDGMATGRWLTAGGSHVLIQKSLGDEAGQPFPDLVSGPFPSAGKWTNAHRQSGRTKIYVRLTYNRDIFPTGIPNITAIIKGKKVYDPRSSLTAWSDNASLCQSDFLCDIPSGLEAIYADEIDEPQLIAASNIDDETVVLAIGMGAGYTSDAVGYAIGVTVIPLITGSGTILSGDEVKFTGDANTYVVAIGITAPGSITLQTGLLIAIPESATAITVQSRSEKRFTLNGSFKANDTPANILGQMLTANNGKVRYIGGLFSIQPGVYVTPTITLTEGDCRDVPHIIPRLSTSDLCNGVKGLYISEYNKWQPTDFPVVTNSTYLTEDGGERSWLELSLPFTKSAATAQRIAKIELERRRQQITVEWKGKFNGYRLEAGNTMKLSFAMMGWTEKIFEVAQTSLVFEDDGAGGVRLGTDLVLRETASGVFDWNSGEETTVDLAPDTNLPNPFAILPPTGVTFVENTYIDPAGNEVNGVEIAWVGSASSSISYYEVQGKESTEVDYYSWLVDGETTIFEFSPVIPGLTYKARVRAISSIGVRSDWAVASDLLINGYVIALPAFTSFRIFFSPNREGNITKVKVEAVISDQTALLPDALALMVSINAHPRQFTVQADEGTRIRIAEPDILSRNDTVLYPLTILAGSSRSRLIATTAENPIPSTTNLAGLYWAQFSTSEWRKVTSYEPTALNFAEPFDIDPVLGATINWVEIIWADQRSITFRLAIVRAGGNYEVVKWTQLEQDGDNFYISGLSRAREGTTQINCTGGTFDYFPAPGEGTEVIDIPIASLVSTVGVLTGETDVDLSIPAGYWASASAAAYRVTGGQVVRSPIIPTTYGGPL